MGFTRIKVQVCNSSDLALCEELEVLVDTGAMMSVIPAPILQQLGVVRVGRRRFRSFDGRTVERPVGAAGFSYQGAIAGAPVILGNESNVPLLGVTALEALGYEVDPVSNELKPIELLMLTQIPLSSDSTRSEA